MKVLKNILNIVLIFAILQIVGMVFTTSQSMGLIDNAINDGKKWSQMGKEGSSGILDKASDIFNSTNEIYNTVRVIGAGIFMVAIAGTAIWLSVTDSTGKSKARTKVIIASIAVLFVLFIFAEQILNFLKDILAQLAG